MVPTLIDGEVAISQSVAIIEYIEERYPQPALLPSDVLARAYVCQIALLIACDIHPLSVMRVRKFFTSTMGFSFSQKMSWYHH